LIQPKTYACYQQLYIHSNTHQTNHENQHAYFGFCNKLQTLETSTMLIDYALLQVTQFYITLWPKVTSAKLILQSILSKVSHVPYLANTNLLKSSCRMISGN